MNALLSARLKRHRRFLTFCAVGATGVLVNLGVFSATLYWIEGAGLRGWWVDNVAVYMGWLVSVASNFSLNDRMTFHKEGGYQTRWTVRLAQYYLSAFAAFIVQWLVFNGLYSFVFTEGRWLSEFMAHGRMRSIWTHRRMGANLVGIGVATVANYMLAKHWVFKGSAR